MARKKPWQLGKKRKETANWSKLTDDVLRLFELAKFEIYFEENRYEPDFEFVAARESLGTTRYYGIKVRRQVSPEEALAEARHFHQEGWTNQQGRDLRSPNHVSETWFITERVDDQQFKNLDSAIRVLSLNKLRNILLPLQPAVRRRSKGRAHTRIGKAVLLNQQEIEALAASLVTLIDERVTLLNNALPNDPDSIAARNTEVAELEVLKTRVNALGPSIGKFKAGTGKETEIVQTVGSLSEGVQSWWSKNHEAICASGYSVALFTTAMSILSLAGVQGKAVALITGVLAGGKTLSDALRSFGKKLFN